MEIFGHDKVNSIKKNIIKLKFKQVFSDNHEVYVQRYFSLSKLSYIEVFVMLKMFNGPNLQDLESFSSKCYSLGNDLKKSKLPNGWFSGVECFAVAIVDHLDDSICISIRNEPPPEHFGSCEMLVVVDSRTNNSAFFEKTPSWGAFYWEGRRRLIREILA